MARTRSHGGRHVWKGGVALLALVLLATPTDIVQAQYFGRNKVVYREFAFRILRTPHYDVHFYPEEQAAVRDAARMAERWYVRHRDTFGDSVARRSLILYASPAHFQQTNVIPDELGEGTGGVTEGYRSRVTLPLAASYAETDHVMGHELVHVFQYAAAEDSSARGGNIGALPLWLVEGMAEYLSLGRIDPQTAMWMRAAVLRGQVPAYKDLTDPDIFPYRYGQALCAYIGGRWGDEALLDLYRAALRQPLEGAIQRTLKVSPEQLAGDWASAMRQQYQPMMDGRTDPRDAGTPVLSERQPEAGLDVAPVVSPDGRYVAFFSSRSLFAIDIFIADITTGRIVRRLTSATSNSHFDALSFVYNAGAWSPDGRQFVFVTFRDGKNALAIVDVTKPGNVRNLPVSGVSGITSPAWSPDGRRIAFSGQAGGVTDLYAYDIASRKTERLTNDPYADLQPTWSPDGTRLAFVTDRGFGTDLERLTYGPLGVATLDLGTHANHRVPLFDGVQSLNPQWSADGQSLYFVSAPDGFQDIYRTELSSGRRYRVTRLATGVSGIAALSPAISVAARTGRLLFSVFDRTGYRMLALDSALAQGTAMVEGERQVADAAILAPADALGRSAVERRVHDMTTGMTDGSTFSEHPYRPSLSLDALSPVTVGVASSTFGTGLVGGVAATWSDELGNRNLGVAVQALGEVRDVGAEVQYLDLEHRWSRMASVGHIPYLTGFSTVSEENVTLPGGTTQAVVITQYRQRVYFDRLQLGARYPFSPTRRLELSAGFTRVSFNTQVQRLAVVGNAVVDIGREGVPSPTALNLGTGTVALVGDNSVFGFTSPVAGGRYRLEVAPSFGDLTYQFVTADVRRYLFLRPLTVAMRGMTLGRYGSDAESSRLSPLYVGDGSMVRGYSVFSFDPAECTATATSGSSCPEFDRLVGSRIGAASLELRVPIVGSRNFGLVSSNFTRIDMAPFVDAGVAWTSTSSPDIVFERNTTKRVPIVSTGLSTRMNVFGAFVVEVFYAKPFQRPSKGWVWGVQLLPGW